MKNNFMTSYERAKFDVHMEESIEERRPGEKFEYLAVIFIFVGLLGLIF